MHESNDALGVRVLQVWECIDASAAFLWLTLILSKMQLHCMNGPITSCEEARSFEIRLRELHMSWHCKLPQMQHVSLKH